MRSETVQATTAGSLLAVFRYATTTVLVPVKVATSIFWWTKEVPVLIVTNEPQIIVVSAMPGDLHTLPCRLASKLDTVTKVVLSILAEA